MYYHVFMCITTSNLAQVVTPCPTTQSNTRWVGRISSDEIQ